MFHSINSEGRLEQVSDRWLEVMGYERGEVIGRRSSEFLTEDSQAYANKEVLPEFFKTGRCTDVPYQFITRSGEIIDVLLSANAERDSDGNIVRSIAVINDVTQLNRTQNELEANQSLLEAFFQAIPDATVLVNPKREIIKANRAVESIFGYRESELIGKTTEIFYINNEAFLEQARLRYNPEAKVLTGESYPLHYRRKNGETFPAETIGSAIRTQGNELLGYLGIMQDVSEHAEQYRIKNQLNEQLQQLNQDLTRSNEELLRFAFVASHDLQEPLRKISSFSELLRNELKGSINTDAAMYLDYLSESAHRMRMLIRDLLMYSRVSQQEISFVPCSAQSALTVALSNLEGSGCVSSDELPEIVFTENHIIQLFQNLVGNGLKYQPKGQTPAIHVSANRTDSGWTFTVRDNGIGIEPRHHKQIFEPFRRLHNRKTYSGTGVGLAICKRIVERRGGTLWVESDPNKEGAPGGCAFLFTVPDALP